MKWLRRVLKSAEYKTEFGEQKENKLSVWRSDELNTKPLKYNSKKVEKYKTIWKHTSYTREALPELCQVGLSAMFTCLNAVNEGLLAKAHGKDLAKCVCWMFGEKQTHSTKKKTSDWTCEFSRMSVSWQFYWSVFYWLLIIYYHNKLHSWTSHSWTSHSWTKLIVANQIWGSMCPAAVDQLHLLDTSWLSVELHKTRFL